MELGELDDPMCTWHFGAKDELFKYRMMGTHPTMSGEPCATCHMSLQAAARVGLN